MKTYKLEVSNLTLPEAKKLKKLVDAAKAKPVAGKAVWGGAEPPAASRAVPHAASDSDSIIWGS